MITSVGKSQSWIHIFASVFRKRRLLGIPKSMRFGNIKMKLWEIGSGDMDWFDVPQDKDQWRALVNPM
jgi:hypothetical protein